MLEIENFNSSKTNISFSLKITNVSNDSIMTYLPKKNDICLQLFKVRFIDLENMDEHELAPCKWYADLDHIKLNGKNTLSLKPNGFYCQKYDFVKKDISPKIKTEKQYKFYVKWLFKDVDFVGDTTSLCRDNVISNSISFTN